MDQSENISTNPRISTGVKTISDIVETRLNRRGFLGGLAATSGLVMTGCATATPSVETAEVANDPTGPLFSFEEISRGMDEDRKSVV